MPLGASWSSEEVSKLHFQVRVGKQFRSCGRPGPAVNQRRRPRAGVEAVLRTGWRCAGGTLVPALSVLATGCAGPVAAPGPDPGRRSCPGWGGLSGAHSDPGGPSPRPGEDSPLHPQLPVLPASSCPQSPGTGVLLGLQPAHIPSAFSFLLFKSFFIVVGTQLSPSPPTTASSTFSVLFREQRGPEGRLALVLGLHG